MLLFPYNLSSFLKKLHDVIGDFCDYINICFNNEQSCVLRYISTNVFQLRDQLIFIMPHKLHHKMLNIFELSYYVG